LLIILDYQSCVICSGSETAFDDSLELLQIIFCVVVCVKPKTACTLSRGKSSNGTSFR
jgi:hypothetical protein